eukprot:tig00000114_g6032.t1
MNAVFRRVLETARLYQADALRFLGDAVLFMLYADRAGGMAAAALAAADMAADVLAAQVDPVLRLHCAITAGDYFALKLGGHAGRFEVAVVGRSLADLEAGLSRAKAGQVSVSGAVLSLLGISARPAQAGSAAAGPEPREVPADGLWTTDRAELLRALGGCDAACSLAGRVSAPGGPHPPCQASRPQALAAASAAAGLHALHTPDVEAVLRSDSGFIRELRIITSLFLRFEEFACPPAGAGGFEQDSLRDLSRRVRIAQAVAAKYGAVIRAFFRDDKGFVGLMTFGLFGSAHTDDPFRAIKCALRIRDAFAEEDLGAVSIGIATGRVFGGLVGTNSDASTTIIVDTATREGADTDRNVEAEALALSI